MHENHLCPSLTRITAMMTPANEAGAPKIRPDNLGITLFDRLRQARTPWLPHYLWNYLIRVRALFFLRHHLIRKAGINSGSRTSCPFAPPTIACSRLVVLDSADEIYGQGQTDYTAPVKPGGRKKTTGAGQVVFYGQVFIEQFEFSEQRCLVISRSVASLLTRALPKLPLYRLRRGRWPRQDLRARLQEATMLGRFPGSRDAVAA